MTKYPNVAGMFYPSDKEELEEILDELYGNTRLENNNKKSIKAIVAPHAGYIYSGNVAMYAYKELQKALKKCKKKPTFVILAPSHHVSLSKIATGTFNKFITPLGSIPVARNIIKDIYSKYEHTFDSLDEAFTKEHALEVHLPFLQYICPKDFDMVPMLIGKTDINEIVTILKEFEQKHDVFFIISSDLSHYLSYNEAKIKDQKTINAFLTTSTEEIIHHGDACGIIPWLILNELARSLHREPQLLHYANSGDTVYGDKDRVVGYASLAYYQTK